MNARSQAAVWLSVLAAVSLVIGCKGDSAEYRVAPVKGTVTFNGQPVKGGSITFQPVSVGGVQTGKMGKPASAAVQDDGTFVLSTYGKEDGAVVGKHQIIYIPVAAGAESYADKPAPSPYAGLSPKDKEVEVKSTPNEINVELVKGT